MKSYQQPYIHTIELNLENVVASSPQNEPQANRSIGTFRDAEACTNQYNGIWNDDQK